MNVQDCASKYVPTYPSRPSELRIFWISNNSGTRYLAREGSISTADVRRPSGGWEKIFGPNLCVLF